MTDDNSFLPYPRSFWKFLRDIEGASIICPVRPRKAISEIIAYLKTTKGRKEWSAYNEKDMQLHFWNYLKQILQDDEDIKEVEKACEEWRLIVMRMRQSRLDGEDPAKNVREKFNKIANT